MKFNLLAGIFAATAALTLATSANAVPAVGGNQAALQESASNGTVERVHYRSYRHSHRNSWRRGRRGNAYGYNRGPSLYLNFGGGSRRGNRGYNNYGGNRRHR